LDIQFTQDSAVAISRSLELTFNFVDNAEKELSSGTQPIDKVKGDQKVVPKEYFPVKVYAIPVIDGSYIKSEYDVID